MKKVFTTVMTLSLIGTILSADTSIKLMAMFFFAFVISFFAVRMIEARELKRNSKYIKNCIMYHYDENGEMLNYRR